MTSEESREASTPGAASQSPDGHRSAPDWSIGVSRGVGRLARSFVDGLGLLWKTVGGERARITRGSGAARGEARQKEGLEELLQQLGTIVVGHAATGYVSLAESDELARLLPRLQRSLRQHRRGRRSPQVLAREGAARSRSGDEPAPEPGSTLDATEAEATGTGESLFDPTELLAGNEPGALAEPSEEAAPESGGESVKGRARKEGEE